MSLEKRVRSVRLSDEESLLFDRIQDKFAPFTKTFKDTVVVCARLVWRMICTPGILNEFIAECQRLQRTTSYTEHQAKQLRLVFGEPLPSMYPKYGGTGASDRPRPDALNHPMEMAGRVAYPSRSIPASVRLFFGQGSTRRVA